MKERKRSDGVMPKYNALDLVTGERVGADSMRQLKRKLYRTVSPTDNVRIWREGVSGHYVTNPHRMRASDLKWDFGWLCVAAVVFGIYVLINFG